MDYDGYEHCLCVRQRGNWFNGVIGEGLSHSIGVRINCYFHLEVEIFFCFLFFFWFPVQVSIFDRNIFRLWLWFMIVKHAILFSVFNGFYFPL